MMRVKVVLAAVIVLSITTLTQSPATFASRIAQTDNRIAALDARTGEVIWIYTPEELDWAHFARPFLSSMRIRCT